MAADRTAVPTISGPAQRRASLPSLTGLRFLAAMCVFLYHTSYLADPLKPTMPVSFFRDHGVAQPIADFLEPAGRIGVSFFFVLSGFVLCWSATPGERATSFWRRRILKIYPNHIVTWALAMWLFASSTPVHAYLLNLFLLHGFSNRPDTAVSVNFPSWSLCCEMLFYALFPLFIVLVRRISERRLWWWAAGMVAGVGAVTVVTTQLVSGGVSSPFGSLSANQEWFGYEFPPPRLFEFVLGMILARIVAAGLWPRIGLIPSFALFAVGYWGAIKLPNPYDFSLVTIVPIGMIMCAAAAADMRGESGWLRSRTMVLLGNVSFAFYMLQALVIFYGRPKVLHAHTYATVPAIGMWILLFLANLLAAWLLYTLVEHPIMRRFARSRKKPAAPVVPPRTAQSVPTGEAV
ncbi:acyltransferase family protein [Actinacidiphila rubida]|uniref:Peptidoglycan/LPS O-acetylase OafA/YrhL, contains acyltransferase and SGNH-hydrolase domains n=1 Tax=Actinacidiphila rubida TaxID=310780 RepID=A0A1H8UM40_9ACTN|nr:acyltransferase [Actinacidiphila rubida]SEP04077.1 Peptidoglycan/LPS O-acetylase OafA/YrhL, contains acyltransferase and SGNH-hydrolase domains [Actinacidiphila rubida]